MSYSGAQQVYRNSIVLPAGSPMAVGVQKRPVVVNHPSAAAWNSSAGAVSTRYRAWAWVPKPASLGFIAVTLIRPSARSSETRHALALYVKSCGGPYAGPSSAHAQSVVSNVSAPATARDLLFLMTCPDSLKNRLSLPRRFGHPVAARPAKYLRPRKSSRFFHPTLKARQKVRS